jgi:hypothetical protein
MNTKTFLSVVLILISFLSLGALPPALGQSNPGHINLGSGAVGAPYTPNFGNYSHIGIVVGHRHPILGESRVFGPLL